MGKYGTLVLVGLLATGEALAQSSVGGSNSSGSSVTLFGVVDAYVAYGTGSAGSRLALLSGGNAASRLGFRGAEDLGGGLSAGFWLEAGFDADNGTGVSGSINNQPSGATPGDVISFNRRATVSVFDLWGELRLGRDFTSIYRNRDQTDPFNTNGVGGSQVQAGTIGGPTVTRASNMIGYFIPPGLGGFFGEVQYFMGENIQFHPAITPNTKAGDGYGGRIGWSAGPFGIAVAAQTTKFSQTSTTGDIDSANVGAYYDFTVVKLTASYFQDKVKSFVPVKGTGYIFGAVVPVFGVDQLKLAYSSYGTDEITDPHANKFAIGYVYNFSKRTAAYATYAHVDNKGNSAFALNGSLTRPGRSSSGYDLGLRHSF